MTDSFESIIGDLSRVEDHRSKSICFAPIVDYYFCVELREGCPPQEELFSYLLEQEAATPCLLFLEAGWLAGCMLRSSCFFFLLPSSFEEGGALLERER